MSEAPSPTASEQFELGIKLEGIFMPYARTQREVFYAGPNGFKESGRFVHYTSAEAALSILRSKRVWMRNTTCMTDYREVQHGYDILLQFFSDVARKKAFCDALDAVSSGVAIEALKLFDSWWANIRFSTYITSISEHDDLEDLHGRLSMWRAFGGNTARVAMVLRLPWFSQVLGALNLMFSPVAYLREEDAHKVMAGVIEKLPGNREFLVSIPREMLVGTVFNMLVGAVTCLKHEGFREEREWRVIYSPDRMASPLMKSFVESVGGIPQTIYKLPIDGGLDPALADLDLVRIFDRLIVGPSQFSLAMYEAFVKTLTSIDIEKAETRVLVSGIPIRS
jgi:hypothetical protein